nr:MULTISPECIES: DUF5916 domain-containing protein [Myxococcaceae]
MLASLPALAAVEGPGVNLFVQTARAQGPIAVDGQLDEADWARAPAFDAFVQRYPDAGRAPSERTEVRILYDAENVYFGITCYDSHPELISRRLGRRDSDLFADAVQVMLDPTHDHRTAYSFYLSAGGVQGDGLFYDDRFYTPDWDGVWAGASGSRPDGWTAEYAIPLSQLRFPSAPIQTWGFSVRRDIPRKNEEIEMVDNPRTTNANVSRMGHLRGLEGVSSRNAVELLPYVAARAGLQPQFSDAAQPHPRLFNPAMDVGLDLRTALTSDLTLNATVNPDFGQVEADSLQLNLSTFETFFQEKRPFFTQGLELFQAVGSETGRPPQSLFYSRRIGLQTPILAAGKVTGTVSKGVEVGLLDAYVMGPGLEGASEEAPDRRPGFHPERPFHLGLNNELPGRTPVSTNYLAAVARASVGKNSRVGGTFTSALPMSGGCTADDLVLDEDLQPLACLGRYGNAGALDFNFKSPDSAYGVLGQVAASQAVAGPPARTLRDGTVLSRGDVGAGTYVRAGKFGGEGFRFDVGYDYASPRLDLNATGFQRIQNIHSARAAVRYARPNGIGKLKGLQLNFGGGSDWTADGQLNRGSFLNFNGNVTLPSFDLVGVETGLNVGGYDIREIDSAGVPLQNPKSAFWAAFAETNPNRAVSLAGNVALGYHYAAGPSPGAWGWGGELTLKLRPHPAVETQITVADDGTPHAARYVDTLSDGRFLFGQLDSQFLSVTLRQSWVITPRLTLQGYAQVFTDYGHYNAYYEATSDAARRPIRLGELAPSAVNGDADFYDAALNLSAVLRWEYRLGSTLFLVYTRAQQGLPTAEGAQPYATLAPKDLFAGPANDVLLLKWTYYWDA